MNTMQVYDDHALTLSLGDYSSYLNYISQIPRITAEEEKLLFKRFQQEGDLDAVRKLIMSHLRFVVHVAKSYSGYGLPMEDIVQEGNVGLMKSVKRFDLSHGCRLASFAVHYIKAEIHEYIVKNWRLVKTVTTKAKRKLFFNLRKLRKHTSWMSNDEVEAIAEQLDVDKSDVLEMESTFNQPENFFDESFGDNVNEEGAKFMASSSALADESNSPHLLIEHVNTENNQLNLLKNALNTLDDRSAHIIQSRWLNESESKITLKHLAAHYGVSQERIRQIEAAALKKLKKACTEAQIN